MVTCLHDMLLQQWYRRAAISTEQSPSNEEDSGGCPAKEECSSKLSLLTYVDGWVIEVPDDDIGSPGHWNQNKDTGQNKEDSRGSQQVGFDPLAGAGALDLFHAADANNESNQGKSYSHTHECTCCFQYWWESQNGVIEFALQCDHSLLDAVHPKPFPDPLKDNNIAANESRYSPLRQKCCANRPNQTKEPKNQSSNLKGIKSHCLFFANWSSLEG
ncbi:hypothetical protein STEG23_006154 [Scotinomys teguina]